MTQKPRKQKCLTRSSETLSTVLMHSRIYCDQDACPIHMSLSDVETRCTCMAWHILHTYGSMKTCFLSNKTSFPTREIPNLGDYGLALLSHHGPSIFWAPILKSNIWDFRLLLPAPYYVLPAPP